MRKYLKIWAQNLAKNCKYWFSMKRCIGFANPHRTVFLFFERYYDAKEVIISAFSELQKISQNQGPNFCKKFNLQWKGASDPWNLPEPFSTFAQDITMLKKWFTIAFAEIEKISQIWTQIRPKIVKNWIFNEKVHRIRETSQNRFPLFRKILRC